MEFSPEESERFCSSAPMGRGFFCACKKKCKRAACCGGKQRVALSGGICAWCRTGKGRTSKKSKARQVERNIVKLTAEVGNLKGVAAQLTGVVAQLAKDIKIKSAGKCACQCQCKQPVAAGRAEDAEHIKQLEAELAAARRLAEPAPRVTLAELEADPALREMAGLVKKVGTAKVGTAADAAALLGGSKVGKSADAYALLNGCLALVRPTATLDGLTTKRAARASIATQVVEQHYFRDGIGIGAIASSRSVGMATIVQIVARKLREGGPRGKYQAQVHRRFLRDLTDFAIAAGVK